MSIAATFAVPCCNGERFLEPMLLSLLAQSRRDFDILLVDDASEDESVVLARQIAGDHIRITSNAERLGIAANWNRCIELVEAPFFCLAHQDDHYEPDYLERMLPVLEANHQIAAVHCLAGTLDENQQKSIGAAETYKRRFFGDDEDRGMVYGRLYRGNYITCPSLLYRKENFERSGPFDESYQFAMDWVKSFELLLAGYELRGIEANLMSYRRHSDNKSSQEVGSLNRFREEQRVLQWARQRGVEAGLLDQEASTSSAVRNTLLLAVYESLDSGDSEQARQLLDFGRAEIPGFSRSIVARLVALCSKLGLTGRATLRLGLKLQQQYGR